MQERRSRDPTASSDGWPEQDRGVRDEKGRRCRRRYRFSYRRTLQNLRFLGFVTLRLNPVFAHEAGQHTHEVAYTLAGHRGDLVVIVAMRRGVLAQFLGIAWDCGVEFRATEDAWLLSQRFRV